MFSHAPAAIAQAQIPRGVADYFWDEAYARRHLEGVLLDLFRTWGYQDVIPPMFEYADTFLHRSSAKLQNELYRFLDRDGSTLTLRGDMTIPVARLVGVRLHDRPMPQRFCYAGSVFRYDELQDARQREFTQAGFELIGASSPAADAEVIALAIQAMLAAGLRDFRLVLGQLQYFHGLLQDLQLTPEQTAQLQRAVDRNSGAELAEFLRETPPRTQQRHTVESLPLLSGPDAPRVLDHADRLSLNFAMHKALANVRDIYKVLEAHALAEYVYLDLTEIRNLGYYTGISFEIMVPGVGRPIGGGGRYDNLIGTFGRSHPAVGVALGVDRLLHAQRMTDVGRTLSATPHILVATNQAAEAFAHVNDWRRAGIRVVVNLDEAQGAQLWQLAQEAGIRLAATWRGDAFEVYGLDPAAPDVPLSVEPQAADTIIQAAKSHNDSQLARGINRSANGNRSSEVQNEEVYDVKR